MRPPTSIAPLFLLCSHPGTGLRRRGVCLVLSFFLLQATLSAAEERPILLFGSGRGVADIGAIVQHLQSGAEVSEAWKLMEGGQWVNPDEFKKFSCVVISVLDETKVSPWTEEDVKSIEQWIAEGGRLILIGGSPSLLSSESPKLGALETLLGAKQLSKSQPSEWSNQEPEFAVLSKDVAPEWMKTGGTALRGLTDILPVAGWQGDAPGVLCGVTHIGKGKVLYLGVSPSKQTQPAEITSIMEIITTFIRGANPAKETAKNRGWGLEPLGQPAVIGAAPVAPKKQELHSRFVSRSNPGPGLVFVKDGQPQAVLVLPAKPSRAARLAAEELQEAFFKMSGGELPVVTEAEVQITQPEKKNFQIGLLDGKSCGAAIFLGDTQFAGSLGIEAGNLPAEGYRIRSRDNVLVLAGNDSRPDGSALMGTYFAAIGLLERHFGVRWLWPGDLGSVYPRTDPLGMKAVDEEDAPGLAQRKIRNAGGVSVLSMEPENIDLTNKESIARLFEDYKSASSVRRIITGLSNLGQTMEDYAIRYKVAPTWFRRQRLGGSFRLNYTHAYDDYYERYGKEHPDWFALQPNGSREQAPERPRLCKSNTGLTDEIGRNILAAAAGAKSGDSFSISPNDGGAENLFCMCEGCRLLDPPNGTPIDFTYEKHGKRISARYPALSDRVVDFYNRIARNVADKRPDLKLGAYAYSFYRTPPLEHSLHPSIVVGFVGTGYFDDYRLAQDRQSWEGWATKANQLFLRPNALHLGHGFPGVFVRKMDRDIKHFYETGMIGVDYDSIVHHWSTQGLNYYVLAKLLWDPSQDAEKLVEDYCRAGFGPAANTVREYFSAVESLTDEAAKAVGHRVDEVLRDEEIVDRRRAVLDMFLTVAPSIYTDERLQNLGELLDRAKAETTPGSQEAERVAFLRNGLRYAQLQSKIYRLAATGQVPSAESKELMKERQELFRSLFKDSFFSVGLVEIARREEGLYRQHQEIKR